MAIFYFKGVNQKGRTLSGKVEAESLMVAKQQIKSKGIFALSIDNSSQKTPFHILNSSKKVDIKTLAYMTRNLSTMIKSGIPLVEALDTISKQLTHPTLKDVIPQIRNSVNEGKSFFSSLEKFPKIFNKTFTSMCEAGEVSGTLDIILLRLAEFTESQSRIQNKVRAALIYPALMTVFSIFMIIFLLTYVVPKVRVLFENNESSTLPWYSKLMMNSSEFLQQYWISIGIVFLISAFSLWRFLLSNTGKHLWDRSILKVPVFGRVVRSLAISRFSKTLSTLLRGGVPVMESLDIVKNVVGNSVINAVIVDARTSIERGDNLSTPLIKSGEFPPMVTQMIRVGEKTGQLESMLSQISETYDDQIKNDVEAMTSLLEPIMLIIMGGVIAFIVFSTIIPLMQIYNTTTV